MQKIVVKPSFFMSLRSQYLSLFTVLVDLIPMVQMDFDAKLTDFGQHPTLDDLRNRWARQLIEGLTGSVKRDRFTYSRWYSPEIQSLLLILSWARTFSFRSCRKWKWIQRRSAVWLYNHGKGSRGHNYNPWPGQLFQIIPSTGDDVIILLILVKKRWHSKCLSF